MRLICILQSLPKICDCFNVSPQVIYGVFAPSKLAKRLRHSVRIVASQYSSRRVLDSTNIMGKFIQVYFLHIKETLRITCSEASKGSSNKAGDILGYLLDFFWTHNGYREEQLVFTWFHSHKFVAGSLKGLLSGTPGPFGNSVRFLDLLQIEHLTMDLWHFETASRNSCLQQ